MRKWYGVLDWPLHAITLVQKYRKSFLFYLQLQDNGKASGQCDSFVDGRSYRKFSRIKHVICFDQKDDIYSYLFVIFQTKRSLLACS